MHLEYESRKHRTEFVHGHRIITFHQHMPTPLADSYYEEFDLEIGGGLPLTEYLKDPLLGILVLHGRTLRAFEPADHVLHRHPPDVLVLGTIVVWTGSDSLSQVRGYCIHSKHSRCNCV